MADHAVSAIIRACIERAVSGGAAAAGAAAEAGVYSEVHEGPRGHVVGVHGGVNGEVAGLAAPQVVAGAEGDGGGAVVAQGAAICVVRALLDDVVFAACGWEGGVVNRARRAGFDAAGIAEDRRAGPGVGDGYGQVVGNGEDAGRNDEDESSSGYSDTSSTDSSGEDDDSDSSVSVAAASVKKMNGKVARVVADDETADADQGPLRTKNEKDSEALVIPKLDVQIGEEHTLIPVGVISSVMEKAIIVKTQKSGETEVRRRVITEAEISDSMALDNDSVLCFSDCKALGRVFETFGPVDAPFYIVRFNSNQDIQSLNCATEGTPVMYVKEMSHLVRAGDVRRKGYDSSNLHDEEVNANQMEYSDDEAEAKAKRDRKRPSRDSASSTGGTGSRGGSSKRGRQRGGFSQGGYGRGTYAGHIGRGGKGQAASYTPRTVPHSLPPYGFSLPGTAALRSHGYPLSSPHSGYNGAIASHGVPAPPGAFPAGAPVYASLPPPPQQFGMQPMVSMNGGWPMPGHGIAPQQMLNPPMYNMQQQQPYPIGQQPYTGQQMPGPAGYGSNAYAFGNGGMQYNAPGARAPAETARQQLRQQQHWHDPSLPPPQ